MEGSAATALFEAEPSSEFGAALLAGLSGRPKRISPKYFYDAAGSRLFDQICALEEYYPTRTETELLRHKSSELAELIGPGVEIVEFGAGSLEKVRILLEALDRPVSYVPIDISGEHLRAVAGRLKGDFPGLGIRPVVADFASGFALPPRRSGTRRRTGFFPGSTIGNFEPEEAVSFLHSVARQLDALLIGVDLVKDPARLHAAYNDREGVTAAFNKNVLARANRECGANFQLDLFDHYAFYNPRDSRIEMHLVTREAHEVRIFGHSVAFEEGESILTEYSYKFTVDGFRTLARDSGFDSVDVWTDPDRLFSVHWLVPR